MPAMVQPERAVGDEGRRGESVCLPPSSTQDAGDDLRRAAVEDGHGDDRRVERDKASIMSAEQDGRQREDRAAPAGAGLA